MEVSFNSIPIDPSIIPPTFPSFLANRELFLPWEDTENEVHDEEGAEHDEGDKVDALDRRSLQAHVNMNIQTVPDLAINMMYWKNLLERIVSGLFCLFCFSNPITEA